MEVFDSKSVGLERERLRSRHLRTLMLLLTCSGVIATTVLVLLNAIGYSFVPKEKWSILCVTFLFSWWVVYFNGSRLGIWTLRRFLTHKSKFRTLIDTSSNQFRKKHGDQVEQRQNELGEWGDIKDKANSTIGTLGILVAVITLFLALVLNDSPETSYQEVVQVSAVIVASLTLILMVFAIDLLDTVSNLFMAVQFSDGDSQLDSPLGYSKYFYQEVGPWTPRGGISYAYYGFSLFTIFIVISVGYFRTWYTGVSVAAYAYLGYNYWFGYVGESSLILKITRSADWLAEGDILTKVSDKRITEVSSLNKLCADVPDESGLQVEVYRPLEGYILKNLSIDVLERLVAENKVSSSEATVEKFIVERVEFDRTHRLTPYCLGVLFLVGTLFFENLERVDISVITW